MIPLGVLGSAYPRAAPGPGPGGDPYWTNVVALLTMSGAETAGGVYTTEADPPFPSGSSAFFDGVNDSLRLPSSPVLDMGALDFTMEMFLRRAKEKQYGLLDSRGGDAGAKAVYIYDYGQNTIRVAGAFGPLFNSSISPVEGQWHHVAVVRQGTTLRAFLDGTQTSSYTNASVGSAASFSRTWVGRLNDAGWFFGGQMAQLRITRGVARYTEGFAPPTAPFPIGP